MKETSVFVSVIAPCYNERDNIQELVESVEQALASAPWGYELIVVDDGSDDGTAEILEKLQQRRAKLRVVLLRRNFGQTAALAAGFDHARGEVIVPIDADLQNDPADIPRLVAKLDEGYDVVSGWRRKRQDHFWSRTLPSRVANRLIGAITGVSLHDYGCSLKAYHRDIVKYVNLYGEMHRFIPALAAWCGAKVTELEVNHRPRTKGQTKYGLGRMPKVILDLITVKFLGTFSTKPLHVFGGIGLWAFLAAVVVGIIVLYQKYAGGFAINRNPLFYLTSLLVMTSVQFLLMGLLAEMQARTYHEATRRPTYVVRRVLEALVPEPSADDSAQGEVSDGPTS